MTKYNVISVSSLSSVNNTCTVKLIFNGHRWDKGKMTDKTYDRLFMIGRSIVSVLVHNDVYYCYWKTQWSLCNAPVFFVKI